MNLINKIKAFLTKIFKIDVHSLDEDSSGEIENNRFVVLDTETTGFDYANDRILCIGALTLKNYRISIEDSFELFIKQEHFNSSTVQIHGILKNSIKNRPSESEALKQFLTYLGDSIIVAHHAFFDISMINKALERNGMPKLTNKSLDTSKLYKKTLLNSPLLTKKEKYSLDELADKFDISKKDRHTALGDALITAIAFIKIINKLKEKEGFNLYQLMKI